MQDGAGAEGGIQLLLTILADGEEQARQLGELPDDPQSRAEHYRGVARRLQCTIGKAMSVAKAIEAAGGVSGSSRGTDRSDSPRSADESPGGTAMEAQERQGVCKRRKGLPRWTAKFRIPDANLEATPDDGFSWRKYGQKDILGARFPRGYYRCTYRTTQGCPATKQVQRSDSDLCVYDVTYQGEHTCHQKQRHATAHDIGQPPPPPSREDPSMQLVVMGFKDVLKVETAEDAASFSFPSVPFHMPTDSSDPGGPSYFSEPRCPVLGGSNFHAYDYEPPTGAYVRGAESSELGEVVSRATGFDYSLYHHAELDPHPPLAPFGGHSSGSDENMHGRQ